MIELSDVGLETAQWTPAASGREHTRSDDCYRLMAEIRIQICKPEIRGLLSLADRDLAERLAKLKCGAPAIAHIDQEIQNAQKLLPERRGHRLAVS